MVNESDKGLQNYLAKAKKCLQNGQLLMYWFCLNDHANIYFQILILFDIWQIIIDL